MTQASSNGPPGIRDVPTLSVVMPSYNHARYIQAALEAHLNQSVPPLEIIVVDDASTDDSCAVVESVAARHPSVRLVRSPCNSGPNAAINRGLPETRGEYLCISTADDRVDKEFAARSLTTLARFPTAAFCFSDPAELLGDTDLTRQFPLYLSERPALFSPDDLERLMRQNFFTFSSNTVVYRREILMSIGGFREELEWQADWFANFVLAFRHGACYVPSVLAYFRVQPDSYSARGLRQAQAQRELLYRVLDLLESEEFRDVRPRFRRSAVVTEMRLRALLWLLASPRHRGYLTPRLAMRFATRQLWSFVRPYAPMGVRRRLRLLAAAPTRRSLANRMVSLSSEQDGG